MSNRWSYKVVEVKSGFLMLSIATVEEQLNQLGLQGWELVNALALGGKVVLYLKKPH